MPTITIQVGQAGNQLAGAWWSLLERQQEHFSNGLLSREWFTTDTIHCTQQKGSCSIARRMICVDSEAKVVKEWTGNVAQHQIHILGQGGCGNNWTPSWSLSTAAASEVDKVLEGVQREAESVGGVPDFLMIGSLAGGTGSGTGSVLLEALADEYPASTVAAVAIAPGHTGDNAVQSINSCLALHHLSIHAHAVVLLDNQTLLDQLNNQLHSSNSNHSSRVAKPSTSPAIASSSRLHGSKSAAAAGSRFGSQRPTVAPAAGTATIKQSVTDRACLAGMNQLAAEALVGLFWPLAEEDGLCGKSNIRQLASTVCGDPVNKFVEVCHAAQPATAWTTSSSSGSSMVGTWSPRIKHLSSQLPRFDPHLPRKAVTTAAALIIARGMPGTTAAAADNFDGTVFGSSSSSSSSRWLCWNAYRSSELDGSSSSSSRWQEGLMKATCSSWPYFTGAAADLHVGSSPAALWSAGKQGEPSLSAAVRRSSIGSFMRGQADRALQLCDSGAYMHWYEQYGCDQQMIRDAAHAVEDMAEAYFV